jgi:hypothetical protein
LESEEKKMPFSALRKAAPLASVSVLMDGTANPDREGSLPSWITVEREALNEDGVADI